MKVTRTNSHTLIMRFLTLILTIAVALEGTGAAEIITVPEAFQTQVLDEKALKAKAEVTRRGVGEKSKVRVKMRDKHQLTGALFRLTRLLFNFGLSRPSLMT